MKTETKSITITPIYVHDSSLSYGFIKRGVVKLDLSTISEIMRSYK